MAVETATMTPPSVFNEEISARVDDAWANEGYVTEDGDRDPKAMHDAVFRVVRKRVATSKEDKAEKAITKGELYAAVFPNAPAGDGGYDQLDEFEKAVYDRIERDVWSLTQPKHGGAIQKRLGEEGVKLVLCRVTIRRPLDKAQAVYLTESPTLIMEDSVDQEIKSLERKAENLRKQLDMVLKRQPELAPRILGRLNQGMNRTQAELAFPDHTQPKLTESTS